MGRKITILLILALAFNLLAMIIVWLHHEFVAGLNPVVSTSFIVLRLLLDLAIIFLGGRWLIRFLLKYFPLSPALLFALGALIIIIGYLLHEFYIGHSTLDYPSPGYFRGARLYSGILFAVLLGVLAGAYHYFPVVAHRSLNPTLGYVHFWATFICACWLFLPKQNEGLAGMPRRYIDYSSVGYSPFFDHTGFDDILQFVLLAAQILFLVNIFFSTRRTTPPC